MSRRAKLNAPSSLRKTSLLDLPEEIQEQLIELLTSQDRASMRLVNRRCCQLVDSCRLWRRACVKIYTMSNPVSKLWELLQRRGVAAIDVTALSHLDLQALMVVDLRLRELWLMGRHLGSLVVHKDSSLLEDLKTITIVDPVWQHMQVVNIFMKTVPWLTSLTVINFQGRVALLLSAVQALVHLELLDLQASTNSESRMDVLVMDVTLSKVLYSLPALYYLRLHRIILLCRDGKSAFSPPELNGGSQMTELPLEQLDLYLLEKEMYGEHIPFHINFQHLPHLRVFFFASYAANNISQAPLIQYRPSRVRASASMPAGLQVFSIQWIRDWHFEMENWSWLRDIPPTVQHLILPGDHSIPRGIMHIFYPRQRSSLRDIYIQDTSSLTVAAAMKNLGLLDAKRDITAMLCLSLPWISGDASPWMCFSSQVHAQ